MFVYTVLTAYIVVPPYYSGRTVNKPGASGVVIYQTIAEEKFSVLIAYAIRTSLIFLGDYRIRASIAQHGAIHFLSDVSDR